MSKPDIHGADHQTGGMDPIPGLGGGGIAFAGYGPSGPTSVPSGVTTLVPLGSGDFSYTSDASIFAAGTTGINILAAGFYKAMWTVNLFDKSGHRVANPDTFIASAGDGGAHWDITSMVYGQQNVPGFLRGSGAEWDIVWTTTAGVGAAHVPQLVTIDGVDQATGETLDAYGCLHIEQLGTDPLGFDF